MHASSRVDVPSQPTASQQTELSRHERLLFRRNNEVLTHAGLATPNAELALVDQDNDQDAYLASYQVELVQQMQLGLRPHSNICLRFFITSRSGLSLTTMAGARKGLTQTSLGLGQLCGEC